MHKNILWPIKFSDLHRAWKLASDGQTSRRFQYRCTMGYRVRVGMHKWENTFISANAKLISVDVIFFVDGGSLFRNFRAMAKEKKEMSNAVNVVISCSRSLSLSLFSVFMIFRFFIQFARIGTRMTYFRTSNGIPWIPWIQSDAILSQQHFTVNMCICDAR